MSIPNLQMNSGHSIPQIGLGTWPMNDEEAERCVAQAIEVGYRHIDTAVRYENETGVGKGLRASGVPRQELFVTSKMDGPYQGDGKAAGAIEESLDRLGLDYLDLYLIHWPLPDRDLYVSTWNTLKEQVAAGKIRSIGVSNFKPAHIDRLIAETGTPPATNQIQISPYITREIDRAYDAEKGIVTVSWSPIRAGKKGLLDTPEFAEIGARYGKTAGQVVLRWHIQLGLVAIPKTSNPERMKENLDIFDFELTPDEMTRIFGFSRGPDAGVDSDTMGH